MFSMHPDFRGAAVEWLIRAERDASVARLMLASDPPFRDVTVFYSQQSAEKALKGFLVAHGVPVRKTHELPSLIDACGGIDPDFPSLRHAAEALTPYISEFRYPVGPLEPSDEEARRALQHAQDILAFVLERIPPPQAANQSQP